MMKPRPFDVDQFMASVQRLIDRHKNAELDYEQVREMLLEHQLSAKEWLKEKVLKHYSDVIFVEKIGGEKTLIDLIDDAFR
jgi:hypothetical protein